jgi:hypothetical protein
MSAPLTMRQITRIRDAARQCPATPKANLAKVAGGGYEVQVFDVVTPAAFPIAKRQRLRDALRLEARVAHVLEYLGPRPEGGRG